MRRNIIHPGADSLTYEIRSIVPIGKRMQQLGAEMVWENIGDPIQKGDRPEPWIVEIAHQALNRPEAWSYCETQGQMEAREVLAEFINNRGGVKLVPEDIIFFNGLGDAISKVFFNMRKEARVLGPSPAYSTFSSAEAAHSGYEHLTYRLDPHNGWNPDVEEIRMKIRYNDTITGILLINPNNPTGAVYDREVLEEIVSVARENDLMLICDEMYCHLVYNGAKTIHLNEVLGEVPAIVMRGISKEFPWPGSRCGWVEVYNRRRDEVFARYVKSLIDAKMLEVSSTSLPQTMIPRVYRDSRFVIHLRNKQQIYEKRANEAFDIFSKVKGVKVVRSRGAFYMSVVFDPGALSDRMTLKPMNERLGAYLKEILRPGMALDQRFAYNTMASRGICVVPLSSFCTPLLGFRLTLLECDDRKRKDMLEALALAVKEYLAS